MQSSKQAIQQSINQSVNPSIILDVSIFCLPIYHIYICTSLSICEALSIQSSFYVSPYPSTYLPIFPCIHPAMLSAHDLSRDLCIFPIYSCIFTLVYLSISCSRFALPATCPRMFSRLHSFLLHLICAQNYLQLASTGKFPSKLPTTKLVTSPRGQSPKRNSWSEHPDQKAAEPEGWC